MNIAIVKLSALGDIIHSAFVVQFIKSHILDAKIDWIVEEGFEKILENNPHIDNIKTVNLKSIKKNFFNIFKEVKKIKSFSKSKYDIVIDLQGLTKSAITSKLLCKNVAGFDKKSVRESFASLFYTKKIKIAYDKNTIDRYRVLISKALEIEISKDDVLKKKPYLFYKQINKNKFLSKDNHNIILIIGANWKSRIYPKEKLITIANSLQANILIPFGNKDEKKDADFIAANTTNVTTLPKMNLDELKALISDANLIIGNDTGPSYIAWANNIPSITLFGPTPPTRIYETKINKLLKSPSKVNPYKLDKNDFSISQIKEEKIIELAKELLDV